VGGDERKTHEWDYPELSTGCKGVRTRVEQGKTVGGKDENRLESDSFTQGRSFLRAKSPNSSKKRQERSGKRGRKIEATVHLNRQTLGHAAARFCIREKKKKRKKIGGESADIIIQGYPKGPIFSWQANEKTRG